VIEKGLAEERQEPVTEKKYDDYHFVRLLVKGTFLKTHEYSAFGVYKM
jgi:hypothetical protein